MPAITLPELLFPQRTRPSSYLVDCLSAIIPIELEILGSVYYIVLESQEFVYDESQEFVYDM